MNWNTELNWAEYLHAAAGRRQDLAHRGEQRAREGHLALKGRKGRLQPRPGGLRVQAAGLQRPGKHFCCFFLGRGDQINPWMPNRYGCAYVLFFAFKVQLL